MSSGLKSLFASASDSDSDRDESDSNSQESVASGEDNLESGAAHQSGTRTITFDSTNSVEKRVSIQIVEDSHKGIAYQLWPAAVHLCRYLESNWPALKSTLAISENDAVKTIELGAGTGLAGLFAAGLGAEVILTELEETLDSLKENLEANPELKGRTMVSALCWGTNDVYKEEFKDTRLFLLADCVYWAHLFDPLADTLLALLTAGGPNSMAVMAHCKRWKRDETFFKKILPKRGLLVKKVLESVTHEGSNDAVSERESTSSAFANPNAKKRTVMRIYQIKLKT